MQGGREAGREVGKKRAYKLEAFIQHYPLREKRKKKGGVRGPQDKITETICAPAP